MKEKDLTMKTSVFLFYLLISNLGYSQEEARVYQFRSSYIEALVQKIRVYNEPLYYTNRLGNVGFRGSLDRAAKFAAIVNNNSITDDQSSGWVTSKAEVGISDIKSTSASRHLSNWLPRDLFDQTALSLVNYGQAVYTPFKAESYNRFVYESGYYDDFPLSYNGAYPLAQIEGLIISDCPDRIISAQCEHLVIYRRTNDW